MKVKTTGRREKPNGNSPWGFQRGLQPLLPNEPRIVNSLQQTELTEKYLLPKLAELEAFLLEMRAMVDVELQSLLPAKLGKPYPLGQCLEITLAVQKLLRKSALPLSEDKSREGKQAFFAFLAAGGALRQVWGDLRGEFFQNAFQLGTLYVDVSNDTVVMTKPKVEILPFVLARLVPIADYRHFKRIAERYWGDAVFPNHVLPELAPLCPLIHINPLGEVCLRADNNYMKAMTRAGRFRPSEAVLQHQPMPVELFDYVRKVLGKTRLDLAASPAAGRSQALKLCQEYRKRRWYDSDRQTGKIANATRLANECLEQAAVKYYGHDAGAAPKDSPTDPVWNSHKFNYLPVSPERHCRKHWRASIDFRFAAGDMVSSLVIQELSNAMLVLPVGFLRDGENFVLVLMQGLIPGRNFCVDTDGRWLAAYTPAVYSNYPFALLPNVTGEKVLCIDENSRSVTDDARDELLLDSKGKFPESVMLKYEQLRNQQAELADAARICAELHQHKLIRPWPIQVINGAQEQQLTGLYRVDAEALGRMPAADLKALQLSGALKAAYCQLISMQQLPVLAKLARRWANSQAKAE